MTSKLLIILIILAGMLAAGCVAVPRQQYNGNNTNEKLCYDNVNQRTDWSVSEVSYNNAINSCNQIKVTESYKFGLKEMKQKDLMSGVVSGSFLLIGGSIYGKVEDKMYLVVTYYDLRIGAYKITKMDLEQLEINTINKNESAYFKYKMVPTGDWTYPFLKFEETRPILYLPDGWVII